MIKPEQIPDEVMLAAREAYMRGDAHISTNMRAAIAAALNAWPGIKLENLCSWVMDGPDLPYVEEAASIILPLPPQEK